jgi:hypothetical protein
VSDFKTWASEVDALCLRHLACSWADLCGDEEPLRCSFESGEAPIEFVRWWAEKFDLTCLAPLPSKRPSAG